MSPKPAGWRPRLKTRAQAERLGFEWEVHGRGTKAARVQVTREGEIGDATHGYTRWITVTTKTDQIRIRVEQDGSIGAFRGREELT